MKETDIDLVEGVARSILAAHMSDLDNGGDLDNSDFARLALRVAHAASTFIIDRRASKSQATCMRDRLIDHARDLFAQLWVQQAKEDSPNPDLEDEDWNGRVEFNNCVKELSRRTTRPRITVAGAPKSSA